MLVQLLHVARSEYGRTSGAGKKEDWEVQKEWEEQEGQEEQDEWAEREETTKGKGALADQGKKLRRGRLIFMQEGTKGWLYGLMWSTQKIDKRRSLRKAGLKRIRKVGTTTV